jgi:hypothetical protein
MRECGWEPSVIYLALRGAAGWTVMQRQRFALVARPGHLEQREDFL